jgi:hypothetical protein
MNNEETTKGGEAEEGFITFYIDNVKDKGNVNGVNIAWNGHQWNGYFIGNDFLVVTRSETLTGVYKRAYQILVEPQHT